jgi:hypothetical protein
MSIFQLLSVWTLRALALWGVLELSGALFDSASEQWGEWRQLEGHRAAMLRLEARTRTAEENLTPLVQEIRAHRQSVAFELNPNATGIDAARLLRDDLMASGAQAPVVDAEGSPAGSGLSKISFHARWREAASASPSVLQALSARRGAMEVRELRMARTSDGGQVSIEARFEALAKETAEVNP